MTTRTIKCNENGSPIGESHWNAKLTDHEVDLLLRMRETGMGYKKLADIFEISKAGVQGICNGSRRGQTIIKIKTVEV